MRSQIFGLLNIAREALQTLGKISGLGLGCFGPLSDRIGKVRFCYGIGDVRRKVSVLRREIDGNQVVTRVTLNFEIFQKIIDNPFILIIGRCDVQTMVRFKFVQLVEMKLVNHFARNSARLNDPGFGIEKRLIGIRRFLLRRGNGVEQLRRVRIELDYGLGRVTRSQHETEHDRQGKKRKHYRDEQSPLPRKHGNELLQANLSAAVLARCGLTIALIADATANTAAGGRPFDRGIACLLHLSHNFLSSSY